MITYSEKVYEKSFSNEVSKQAYLDACVWLAKHVYSRGNLPNYISVKIVKAEKKIKNKFVFKVEVFATIEEDKVYENFCYKCKQMHTIFYSIDKPECCKCNMFVYRQRIAENMQGVKSHISEILEELDE